VHAEVIDFQERLNIYTFSFWILYLQLNAARKEQNNGTKYVRKVQDQKVKIQDSRSNDICILPQRTTLFFHSQFPCIQTDHEDE